MMILGRLYVLGGLLAMLKKSLIFSIFITTSPLFLAAYDSDTDQTAQNTEEKAQEKKRIEKWSQEREFERKRTDDEIQRRAIEQKIQDRKRQDQMLEWKRQDRRRTDRRIEDERIRRRREDDRRYYNR